MSRMVGGTTFFTGVSLVVVCPDFWLVVPTKLDWEVKALELTGREFETGCELDTGRELPG